MITSFLLIYGLLLSEVSLVEFANPLTLIVAGIWYYGLTKMLSFEVCKIYARTYGIQTVCFVFNGLGANPTERNYGKDFPPFTIVWEDLQHACRLALEIPSVSDNYQDFNMLSFEGHGKYNVDKARRILGFEPTQRWEDHFKRVE